MRTILALLLLTTAAQADCLFEGDKVVDPSGRPGVVTSAFCDERIEAYDITYADKSTQHFEVEMGDGQPLPMLADKKLSLNQNADCPGH